MPPSLFGYIWKTSARHQLALAALSVMVFLLSAAPLELQRRIVNDAKVGTVVAFVSGLAKVNDPWGDIVNWFRTMTECSMRYRMVSEAMRWLAQPEGDA